MADINELQHQQEIWDRRLKSGHGAYDGESRTGTPAAIIMLAGPVKWWWDANWMTPAHIAYVDWRQRVTDELVAAGYLVYQPHAAFKGTWNEAAQVVNNAIIGICDAMVVLTPPGVLSDGTDEEVEQARLLDRPIVFAPPNSDMEGVLHALTVATR
jgi:hypothetical protein